MTLPSHQHATQPQEQFYLTTPIYYVNDIPHIGHVYTSLCADVIARFYRLAGAKVHLLTGTDEHGQKIEKAAISRGYQPQQYCDHVSSRFKEAAQMMNISYDVFARTSSDQHKEVVQQIWQKLIANGDIYLDKYCGWYSIRDEAFYDESEIVEGKAPSGAPVEWVEESSYFFRLSKWQDKLLAFYEEHPNFVLPHYRYNEVKSFVSNGLRDLSVSRTSFGWGIKVPHDEEHVIYVWLDALFIYYSAVQSGELQHFWPANLHIVGKDILRFHAVYWPAFLMAADLELPKRIFAHGWWLAEGEKMSKSLGNVIDPFTLKEKFGLDYLRYYLVREMPFGNDHSYSPESFISRVNAELCNNIGNLCQRVATFVWKNLGGIIPSDSNLQEEDLALLQAGYTTLAAMKQHMEEQALHNVFNEIIKLGNLANEYVDKQAPWALAKSNPLRMNAVLYTLLEVIRIIGILLQPVIPDSAGKILNILNVAPKDRSFDCVNWEYRLKPTEAIQQPEPIFPRIN